MSATATVPSAPPLPVRLTIVFMPAPPASAIDPAPAGDPRVLAGLPGWPEGEPTWEDAEWR